MATAANGTKAVNGGYESKFDTNLGQKTLRMHISDPKMYSPISYIGRRYAIVVNGAVTQVPIERIWVEKTDAQLAIDHVCYGEKISFEQFYMPQETSATHADYMKPYGSRQVKVVERNATGALPFFRVITDPKEIQPSTVGLVITS